ncbi:Uma2 family endonuclease [Tenggerimyces flavus]|uniref:Uma2 family endonuclease n=1 Tax=Tenggerimyces flavus TaxID=1708749 RepID=A0ABV7YJJ1_9ACTN|nr:Uma2 family endonuclease [Tenggerimyces flavus]MBM7784037.1 Uma2 family endonuclease [Tenggerimyces flavus]
MSVQLRPGRMTVREFMDFEYDRERFRYELQEGNLVTKSSPVPRHNVACARLFGQLEAQFPAGFMVVTDIDVDLQLAPADGPGTVRQPDVVVFRTEEYDRVHEEHDMIRASSLVLAVEVHSPGSVRTDRVIKFMEYRDAGIAQYWMIDLDPPVTLRPYHLAGPFKYLPVGPEAVETYQTVEPFPLTIDLDALVRTR